MAARPGQSTLTVCPKTGWRTTDGEGQLSRALPSAVRRAARRNASTEAPGTPGAESVVRLVAATFLSGLWGRLQLSDTFRFLQIDNARFGGPSSATTVLALSAVRYLRADAELPKQARKLLCFSDSRQDASLQAGHINDFIEVGLLRSALYQAALSAGPDGLGHDLLTHKVAEALGLGLADTPSNPDVRFSAREQTDRALRDVLGYRLYLDQRRGWRVTSPNLEQSGLLRIEWQSLGEVCAAEDVWAGSHPVLAGASASQRAELGRTLLDWLRRELAIKVEYLSSTNLDLVRQRSSQWLRDLGRSTRTAAWTTPLSPAQGAER